MRVLLVPDKFKGSLSADGVMAALGSGIKQVYPKSEIHTVLASDGGDGFLGAVAKQLPTEKVSVATVDPLGRAISTFYLWDVEQPTAYIELASASGLELLEGAERSALKTSTLGTGILLKDALSKGAESVYVGLGGSATNDAGTGIAAALGYRFLDAAGVELEPTGENLVKIATIENGGIEPHIDEASIYAVNDVDNPLFGKTGAAHIYGGQKGADEAEIEILDAGLKHLDKVVKDQLGKDLAEVPGSGAAGGTAYGLQAFLHAEYIAGTDFVLGLANVDTLLRQHPYDYIITGEGKFDEQTLNGKLIKGVVDLGRKFDVPVIAICGKLALAEDVWKNMGLEEVLEIHDSSMPIAYSMENASSLIQSTIEAYLRSV